MMSTPLVVSAPATRGLSLVVTLYVPLAIAACSSGGRGGPLGDMGGGGTGGTLSATAGAAGQSPQRDAGGGPGRGAGGLSSTTDLQAQMIALQAQVSVVDGLIRDATPADAGGASSDDIDTTTARASADLDLVVKLAGQSPTPSEEIRAAVVDGLAIDLRLVQAAASALASAVTMNEPRQANDQLDEMLSEVSPLAFALKRQSDAFIEPFQEPVVHDFGTWFGALNPRRLPNGDTLIAECWGNRVVELDAVGRVIWQFPNVGCPTAAERLSSGNTLIADRDGMRAVEVDPSGAVVWEKAGLTNLYGVQRLGNGNTLLVIQGDYTGQNPAVVREVTAAGDVVWEYSGDGTPLLAPSAERLSNGNTLIGDNSGYFTGTARVLEIDPSGTTVWSFTDGIYGIYGVKRLDNGDTLINDQANGRLIEVTPTGEIVWRYGGMETPGGFDVLSGGGLLICDWALDRVFEIGPRGAP